MRCTWLAVISSDAGHNAAQNSVAKHSGATRRRGSTTATAVAKLTRWRRRHRIAYGRFRPVVHRGCSNGGRHAMVAASRYAATTTGPRRQSGNGAARAAIANIAGYQTYASLATDPATSTGFTAASARSSRMPCSRAAMRSTAPRRHDPGDRGVPGRSASTPTSRPARRARRHVPVGGAETGIDSLFRGAVTSTNDVIIELPYDTALHGGWSFGSSRCRHLDCPRRFSGRCRGRPGDVLRADVRVDSNVTDLLTPCRR